MIAENWVMTAAHCLVQDFTGDYNHIMFVVAGEIDLNKARFGNSSTAVFRQTERAFVHPGYRGVVPGHRKLPAASYDIGLLYLAKPVIWNDFIRPACLPRKCDRVLSQNSTIIDGCQTAWAAGWGITDESLFYQIKICSIFLTIQLQL